MSDEEKKRVEEELRTFSEKLELFVTARSVPEEWKEKLLGDDYLLRYGSFSLSSQNWRH